MLDYLNGLIDMHVHGSPSVADRIETWTYLKEMDDAGYAGVGYKEHYFPTVSAAYIYNHSPLNFKLKVIGSLVMNNACGGFSREAVDAACLMGAKIIYMPTVSSKNHCEYLKTVSTFGGGKLSYPEKPLTPFDKDGNLQSDLLMVLRYLSDKKNVTLSMGHLSAAEIDKLLPIVLSFGISKVVIDHPYFIIGATIDQISRWAQQGAFINFTCSSLKGIGKNGHVDVETLKKTLECVPDDKLLISTDYGQPYNGSPVKGMYSMLILLSDYLKIPSQRIYKMTHDIPAYLMDM